MNLSDSVENLIRRQLQESEFEALMQMRTDQMALQALSIISLLFTPSFPALAVF